MRAAALILCVGLGACQSFAGTPDVSAALIRDVDTALLVARADGPPVPIACLEKYRSLLAPLNDGDPSPPGPVTALVLGNALRALARQCVLAGL